MLRDERRQLGDAMLDGLHHPRLRYPRSRAIPRAVLPTLREEPVVELAAILLGRAHGGPVALRMVGHEARADDADATLGRIPTCGAHGLAPWVEHLRTLALLI